MAQLLQVFSREADGLRAWEDIRIWSLEEVGDLLAQGLEVWSYGFDAGSVDMLDVIATRLWLSHGKFW